MTAQISEETLIILPTNKNKESAGCQIHKNHGSAQPYRLVGHHVFPQSLQKKVYGKVTNQTLVWVCDNGHYTIHGILTVLMLGHKLSSPQIYRNKKEYALAVEAFELYKKALEASTKNGGENGRSAKISEP
jgi:hypothetical protein